MVIDLFDNIEAIYTYDDPFKINNADYWDKIENIPHLCASQTLVQGMSYLYNDEDYNTPFFVIDDFIELYYESWESKTENKIKQYCSISDYITNLPEDELKFSLKFNKREIYKSLRILKELNISPRDFNIKSLASEQKVFIDLYKNLFNDKRWNLINQHGEALPILKKLITKKALSYQERAIRANDDSGNIKKWERKYKQAKRIRNNLEEPGAIVISGLHRFNSLILRLLEDLQKENIKIYFLFNYNSDFEKIYSTWDKVYAWLDNDFIQYNSDFRGNKLGEMLGDLLEGNLFSDIDELDDSRYSFKAYDNLTAFSDEIKRSFERARHLISKDRDVTKKPQEIFGSKVLGKMNHQYYAPDNEIINGLLKSYFPEQFGDKPFLSYPIGQFILNLYNMWDEDNQKIEIDDNSLKECIYYFSRIDNGLNPLLTYEKVELYLQNIRGKDDYIKKINKLIKINQELKEKNDDNLNIFSFYNLYPIELEHLQEIIKTIFQVMEILFNVDNNGLVNFKEHYQALTSIIKSEGIRRYLNKAEEEIAENILKRLDNSNELDYKGYISDLKESLHFYLSNKRKEDPHWIVRNLEQLDGDVLLSKNNVFLNSRTYHLALISDANMNYSLNNLLPWPLTESFFQAYSGEINIRNKINTILEPLREYSNFLRFSLFYASYYTNSNINISYVKSYKDEKQNPYFLLDMLGVDFDDIDQIIEDEDDSRNSSLLFSYDDYSYTTADFNMSDRDYQYGLLCPLRFFINKFLSGDDSFKNEYHVSLAVTVLLLIESWEKLQGKPADQIEEVVKQEASRLRKDYFPYYYRHDFLDKEKKVIKKIKNDYVDQRGEKVYEIKSSQKYYLELRKRILYGKISNKDKEKLTKNIFNIDKNEVQNEIKTQINNFIKSENSCYDLKTDEAICELCENQEICLKQYLN